MFSLDIDFALVWPWVTMIVTMMWPVFAIPLGIKFGFGILDKVVGAISHALGRA